MSKDKKKKSKHDDAGHDSKKKRKKSGAGVATNLKALAENPIVADVVAAALVGMAAALKDSEKAKKLASKAGDQLDALSKKNVKKGGAMWDLALNIGRQTLEALAEDAKPRKGGKPR